MQAYQQNTQAELKEAKIGKIISLRPSIQPTKKYLTQTPSNSKLGTGLKAKMFPQKLADGTKQDTRTDVLPCTPY